MADVLHLGIDDARREPWPGGGGEWLEIALWPEEAVADSGEFDWRLSTASVRTPGPLADLPGFERLWVVIGGDGLLLDHAGEAPRARLRALEPYRFSGDWPTSAEPTGGQTTVFEVLVRRAAGRAQVELLRLGARRTRASLARGQALLYLSSGRLQARLTGEDDPFELSVGESLWIDDLRAGDELELEGLTGDTLLLLIRIEPRES